MAPKPVIAPFYDPATGSFQYVVHDPGTRKAATVDVVWDYDPNACRTSTTNADRVLDHIAREGLEVVWILDTHPHADHFIAGPYLQEKLGAPRAIGERVRGVQQLWRDIYGLGAGFPVDGSQWDRLFHDGERFAIGELEVEVIFSPGHTMASITYVVGDAAFVHDTFMMPDLGTSRADFPGGDAGQLYDSLHRLLKLPDATRLYVGHDYPSGREPACMATVAEQRTTNIHLRDQPSKADYVAVREERDATLALPDRMLAALQVNIRGGRLPDPEPDGHIYLKLPVDRF